MSRRFFLINIFIFLAVVFAKILKFLTFPVKKGKSVIEIELNNLKEGVNHFPDYSFLILKKKNKIIAMSDICTHLGCKINFIKDKNIFQCPCHRSEFSIYGRVIKGPAKKNLKRLKFKVMNKKIKIIV